MKRYDLLKVTSCLSTAGLILLSSGYLPHSTAFANPSGGNVVRGNAAISQTGNRVDIHQNSQKAIIDWRSFDVGAGEKTQFHQPNQNSVTLNRVGHGPASQINGGLKANGHVIIVNPNGVVFGSNAKVDVNGMVASTADIDNQRFMDGDYRFDKPGNPNARIENHGTITAKDAGLVGLVAPNVLNHGVINARLGRAQLASGDTATIDLYGNGLMEVRVSDAVQSQIIENHGVINAQGGTIAITAAAAKDMVNSLVTVSGELNAPSVGVKNGKIIIAAAGSNAVAGNVDADKGKKSGESRVLVEGTLNASGNGAGEKGGDITVTADAIALAPTAKVDASGRKGGGNIKIGGAYQGKGETPAADRVMVAEGATIKTNATHKGNGGEVIVWADKNTSFAGRIEAKGGAQGGNGGFAEVSGKQWLDFRGVADMTAVSGKLGTLLLDPTTITITIADSVPAVTWNPGTFTFSDTDNRNSASIDAQRIVDQLNLANVTVTTNSAGAGAGNMFVYAPIVWDGVGSLTLFADGYMHLGGRDGIVADGSIIYRGNNNVSATLQASEYIALYDASSIYVDTASGATGRMDVTLHSNYNYLPGKRGAVRLEGGSSIRSNGGDIVMGGGYDPRTDYAVGDAAYFSGIRITGTSGSQVLIDASRADGTGGNIIMNGAASGDNPASPNRGIYNQYTTISTNGDGGITMRAQAGAGTNIDNEGLNLTDSVVQAQNGNIYLEGNAISGTQRPNGVNLLRTSVTSTAISPTASIIEIIGRAGAATNTSEGVADNNQSGVIIGTGSSVNSGYADIFIDGTGGNGVGVRARGVIINGVVQSTGTGSDAANISIKGQGGSGSARFHEGVLIQGTASGTRISSIDGDVDIEGVAGANSDGHAGILFAGSAGQSAVVRSTGAGEVILNATAPSSNPGIETSGAGSYTIGNASGTGNVSLIIDALGTLSGLNIQSGADVILRPLTAGREVVIGAGGNANSLNITDAILANISDYGTLWLGGENVWQQSGNISVNSNAALNGNVNFISGNDITLTGNTLRKTAGAAEVDWNFLAGGDISTTAGGSILALSGGINLLFNSGYNGGAGTDISIGAGTSFDHDGTLTFIAPNLYSLSALDGDINWFTDAAAPTASFVAGTAHLYFAPLTAGRSLSIGSGAGCDICLSDATITQIQNGFGGGATFGTATTGNITNRTANWNIPVAFRTAGQFINNIAVTAAGDFHVVANGNITLNNSITSNGAGANALVLAAGGNFINNAGAGALSAPNSRWLVYSTNPVNNLRNGLLPQASDFGKTYAADAPATIGAGNRFIYATITRPTLNLRVNDNTVIYGQPYTGVGGYGYLSGLVAGDTLTNIGLSGAPLYHAAYSAGDSQGVKTGALTATVDTLASVLGYNINFTAGNLTVLPANGGGTVIPPSLPSTVERVWQDPSIMYDVQNVSVFSAEDPELSLVKTTSSDADEKAGKTTKPRSAFRHWLGGLLRIHPHLVQFFQLGDDSRNHIS